MTSGLSGSPEDMISRMFTFQALMGSWISIRQTVGGAQKVVTPWATSASSAARGSKRPASATTVAPAFQGANTLDQACFAQPGEEMLRCTSPGLRPSPYMVVRWPIG